MPSFSVRLGRTSVWPSRDTSSVCRPCSSSVASIRSDRAVVAVTEAQTCSSSSEANAGAALARVKATAADAPARVRRERQVSSMKRVSLRRSADRPGFEDCEVRRREGARPHLIGTHRTRP
ncbi:hypothetical protein TPR58_17490 [Sphingomonas sp. HF-S3]|uniref:Uncharacterized protein n=1 Tax=Sphingomonas rustica TaxID=3103142 RepID=A0ABV0BBM1_9SPHN